MAVITLSAIKNLFLTGGKPTQVQYHNVWDSFFHKSETVPQASVTGLEAALADVPTQESIDDLNAALAGTTVSKTNGQTIAVESGKLVDVVIVTSATSQNVKIESGSGLEDVVPLTAFSAGQTRLFRCDFLSVGASTLTVTCTGSITIKYFKR